jgi:hypothetical protein
MYLSPSAVILANRSDDIPTFSALDAGKFFVAAA